MKTRIVEATNGQRNYGKFLLAAFTDEWQHRSKVLEGRLLPQIGWDTNQIWILDLQTCEGAAFTPGGLVKADLEKHGIWVCPLYEPFLEWLWKLPRQQVLNLDVPDFVDLGDVPFALRGYRRPGPEGA